MRRPWPERGLDRGGIIPSACGDDLNCSTSTGRASATKWAPKRRRSSDKLDGRFSQGRLEEALEEGKPESFNTDQGVHYAARSFTGRLVSADTLMSINGRGWALDNILGERL